MEWKICSLNDVPLLAELNGQLHEDEGATPMEPAHREARLAKWLASGYTAVLFSRAHNTVGYTLYCATDPDAAGLDGGIYIRQFFVVRDQRRAGIGRQMFDILSDEVWPAKCGILLETEHDNHWAQAFWRSVGFGEYHLSFVRQPGAN